jgi:lactoylglutathione lyase
MTGFTVTGGFDLGLFSDNPRMPSFYDHQAGLPFVETLRHSPTYEERFYSLGGGSSLKINYSTEPMPDGRSGYQGLTIARTGEAADIVDPDGLPIAFVAPESLAGALFGITSDVADVDAQERFLVEGLGAERHNGGFRLGNALLTLRESTTAGPATPTWSRGFNYIVAFVDDILAAHDGLIARGAEHSVPPIRLADRCVFSWLRDPGGNWLELVQPASQGAPLPDVTPIESRWQEIIAWRETGAGI